MEANLQRVSELAPDLNEREPRSPSEELAGFKYAARCLDKCRATLAGKASDYTFGCPMDQKFLSAAGLDAETFKKFVSTGADDNAVAEWIKSTGKPAAA